MKKNNTIEKYRIKYFQNNFQKIYVQSNNYDRYYFSIELINNEILIAKQLINFNDFVTIITTFNEK